MAAKYVYIQRPDGSYGYARGSGGSYTEDYKRVGVDAGEEVKRLIASGNAPIIYKIGTPIAEKTSEQTGAMTFDAGGQLVQRQPTASSTTLASSQPQPTGTGYTRDAQGNVYDAQGGHVTLDQLPKGADGNPLMNLETLPLQGQQPVTQTQPQNPATDQNGAPDGAGGQLDATLGVNPAQVGGKFGTQQFGKIGNDVYEIMSDGTHRKVTEAEFNQKLKAQGLNLDVLPQLDQNQGFQDGPPSGTAGSGPDGIMGTADDTGEPKTPSGFVADYQGIIKELGLTSIKDEFNNIQKEFDDLQEKKLDEQLEIQDNPWISESIRVARLNKLDEKYEGKELILTNKLKLYDSLYDEGVAQAKFLTSGMQEDRNKLLDLAMKREEAEAKLSEVDTQVIDVNGRKLLIDTQTGKTISDLGKSTSRSTPTEGDKQVYETRTIEDALNASKNGGVYVDGNVYIQQRTRSRMSPAEFDSRFGLLLSSDDRRKYNIAQGTNSVQKAGRLQELLMKSENGKNLDSLSPSEQAELYSLL